MKKILLPLIFITSLLSCKDKEASAPDPNSPLEIEIFRLDNLTSSTPFNSREELAAAVIEGLNQNDLDKLASLLVSGDFYEEYIYPQTQEGLSSNALPGKEFYNMMIKTRRMNHLLTWFEELKSKKIELLSLQKPIKSTQVGSFTFHKYNPMEYEITDIETGTQSTIVDNRLLGIIIERNEKFFWLNVFD